ncbi:hypothetical protein ABTH94_22515, partial [Acinetobacter baumannii]
MAVPTLKDKELYLKFEFTNKRVKSLTFVTIAIALGMSIVAYLLRSYFSKTIMAEEIAPSMKRVTDQAS